MSAGHIDDLLQIWATSLLKHGEDPPFKDHRDMYKKIDDIKKGDVPWKEFSIIYTGEKKPVKDKIPTWMDDRYTIYYRDPHQVVKDMLKNPDFKDEIDFGPVKESNTDGDRLYGNFMSGNWAWRQAVSFVLTRTTCIIK